MAIGLIKTVAAAVAGERLHQFWLEWQTMKKRVDDLETEVRKLRKTMEVRGGKT